MANTFKRATAQNVGTTPATLYTVPVGVTAVVHGLFISNLLTSDVLVTLKVGTLHVLKNVPVKAGATAIPNKPMNFMAGDVITVKCSVDLGADIYMSILEVS